MGNKKRDEFGAADGEESVRFLGHVSLVVGRSVDLESLMCATIVRAREEKSEGPHLEVACCIILQPRHSVNNNDINIDSQ